MPSRDWKFRIEDILDAIESIQSYTDGMDLTVQDDLPAIIDPLRRLLASAGD